MGRRLRDQRRLLRRPVRLLPRLADPAGSHHIRASLSDPDSLADLPDIQTAAAEREDVECEAALSIAWTAYETATGEQLPADAFTIRYRDLDPGWDFDDRAEMRRRLPRLTALYTD
jgi:hypothetical protein